MLPGAVPKPHMLLTTMPVTLPQPVRCRDVHGHCRTQHKNQPLHVGARDRPCMQDAIKKMSGSELPDFYNIVLERPRDDPAGYDVLFVDAASKVCLAGLLSTMASKQVDAGALASALQAAPLG